MIHCIQSGKIYSYDYFDEALEFIRLFGGNGGIMLTSKEIHFDNKKHKHGN